MALAPTPTQRLNCPPRIMLPKRLPLGTLNGHMACVGPERRQAALSWGPLQGLLLPGTSVHVAPSPPPEAYPEQPTQNSPASPLTSFPAVASPPDTLGTNLSAHLQEPIKCSLGILCDHGHHCAKTPPRTSTSAASENYLWPSQGGCNRGSKAPARTSELEPHRSS